MRLNLKIITQFQQEQIALEIVMLQIETFFILKNSKLVALAMTLGYREEDRIHIIHSISGRTRKTDSCSNDMTVFVFIVRGT